MELVFAYLAGLLTLINPCVLPVLPIVLATALQASRHGPLVLAAGMSLSFVTLGMAVTSFGYAVGLNEQDIARAGAVLMVGFGLILLVPRFSTAFSTATAGFASSADAGLDNVDRNTLRGQFLGGMLLGAVWSPCVGHVGRRDFFGQSGAEPWMGGCHHGVLCHGCVDHHSRTGLWRAFCADEAAGVDAAHCSCRSAGNGGGLYRRGPDAAAQCSPHDRRLVAVGTARLVD